MQISAMPKKWLAFLLIVVAAIALGCAGQEAETGPSAEEIARLVSDSVNVSVSQAVAKAVPEGTSAEEMKRMVEAAVAASAQPGVTRAEVEAAVTASAQAATAGQLTAAEVQRIVDASVQALPAPQIDTSALRPLVEQAVAASVPEGVSADQIAKLVEAAVGGATAGVPTRAELTKSIEDAVKDAAAGQLTGTEVQNIVNASLAATEAAVERAQKAAESAAENAAMAAKEAAAAAAKEVPVEVVEVIKVVQGSNPTIFASTPPSFFWDGSTPSKFNEAPMLADLVRQNTLPPVDQRLPDEPLVMRVVERIGDYGGTMRVVTSCTSRGGGYKYLHDQAMILDLDDQTVIPHIAKRVLMSDDYKEATIFLRKGAKWSDGAPYTADDWVFAVEDVRDNTDLYPDKRDNRLSLFERPNRGTIQKIDDYTFKYIFEEPDPDFAQNLSEFYFHGYSLPTPYAIFMPKHYLSQFHPAYVDKAKLDQMVAEAGLEAWVELFKQKVGLDKIGNPSMSGWIIVDDTPGAPIYERNPYYFAVDPEGNQLPYIDRHGYSCAESGEGRELKMIAGESDFQVIGGISKYPVFQKNAERGNYRTIGNPNDLVAGVVVNQTHVTDPYIGGLLRTRNFRIAVSLAIDKQSMNETFMYGLGVPANYFFMRGKKFYDDIEAWRFKYTIQDVVQANALLDGLGLDKRDGDGFRMRNDGTGETLELTISMVGESTFTPFEMAETVAQYLQDVGLKVTPSPVPGRNWGAFLASNEAHLIGVGGFQAGRVPPRPEHHWGQLYNQWWISGGTEGVDPGAPGPLHHPDAARLFEIFGQGQTLPYDERGDIYKEAYKLIADSQMMIGIVAEAPFQNSFTIVSNKLKNIAAPPIYSPGYATRYPSANPSSARLEQAFFEGGENNAGQ